MQNRQFIKEEVDTGRVSKNKTRHKVERTANKTEKANPGKS